jgi:hypothetical protein
MDDFLRQEAVLQDAITGRDWLGRYNAAKCAKCCGRLIDARQFPAFVDELVRRWHEFYPLYQRFRRGPWLEALAIGVRLAETARFRVI